MKQTEEKNLSLTQQAYELIKEKILNFELEPGEQVSDFLLSNSIGMSRTPIREALALLNGAGLIESKGKKQYVTQMQASDIQELYLLHEALECAAARQIIEHNMVTPALLENLRQNTEELRLYAQKKLFKEYFACDDSFHTALILHTKMKRLISISKNCTLQLRRFRWLSTVDMERFNTACDEHAQIIRCLEEHNYPACAAALHAHFSSACDCYCDTLNKFSTSEWVRLIRAFSQAGK